MCFASHDGFGGCVTSCRSAAAVLGGTWAALDRKAPPPAIVVDAGVLVLSSWDESYDRILELRASPTVLRWHSPVLQSELGQEAWKVARAVELLDAGAVAALAVNDASFVDVLGRDGVIHLPDVFDATEYGDVEPAALESVNISLFGAGHWRKNLFVQSAAFELARRARDADWTLHLNGQTAKPAYADWLSAVRVPYVEHGYLERDSYLSLVAAMDAGLCASLSESFCYVAADHVALGVPVVTSPAISCLDGGPLEAARPGDVELVARLLADACETPNASVAQRSSLAERAAGNADTARAGLETILELASTTVTRASGGRR